ncbi:MAG: glycosyltransferase family 87 protein [Planctomycetota bacterium]
MSSRRWIWPVLWIALGLFLVARASGRPPSRGVLLDHLEFGRRFVHGEDVYGPWRSSPKAAIGPLHAPYPPSFGLLTAPFHLVDAALGQAPARFAWAVLQMACLLVGALQLRRLMVARLQSGNDDCARLDADERRRWQWLWLATFGLTLRFVLRDTHGGGGNLINVAFVLLAYAASERGHDRSAGAWLAFSLVTKPTMVWLLPVFLLFGRWRTVAWTLLAGAGFVLLTMAIQRFELAPWWRWLQGSWALATQADPWAVPAFEFPRFEWMNQALRFCLARWFGEVPPEFAARVELGTTAGLGLDVAAVGWIVRLTSLSLLGAVLLVAHRARHSANARLWVVVGTFALTLLLSPLSWKGHHVALLPLVLLLVEHVWRTRSRAVTTLLAVWFVGCSLPGGDLVGDAVDEWLNSTYVVTFGDVALLLGALLLAWRAARSAPTEHRDPARSRGLGEPFR